MAEWGVGESSCVCQHVEEHPPYRDQIKDILSAIDFMRIEAVMQQLSWKVFPGNKVPTIDELIRFAKDRLEEVSAKGPGSWNTCAGFHVENNYGVLRLAFEIESGYGDE
jgi:hypothetical protein